MLEMFKSVNHQNPLIIEELFHTKEQTYNPEKLVPPKKV